MNPEDVEKGRGLFRILMLGNSLTSANGLPELLAGRLSCEVTALTRGGARLAEFANPATRMGAALATALAEDGWSHVVLQEMSNGCVTHRASYHRALAALVGAVREAGAVPVVFATWPAEDGSMRLARLGYESADEMRADMLAAFTAEAKATSCFLADACTGFLPSMYAPDGMHPNADGSRFAADVLAGVLSARG